MLDPSILEACAHIHDTEETKFSGKYKVNGNESDYGIEGGNGIGKAW